MNCEIVIYDHPHLDLSVCKPSVSSERDSCNSVMIVLQMYMFTDR